jgi:hypothetical protein
MVVETLVTSYQITLNISSTLGGVAKGALPSVDLV